MTAGTPAPTGHVICGVDGSDFAQHAVDWAADEAVLRGTTLELVHAWEPKAFAPDDWHGVLHDAGVEALHRHAEQARRRHVDLIVTTDVVHADAADVLEAVSARAGLLVVGRRGLGGFTGMLLGSVSRKLAGRTHCPLLVVPADERGTPPGADVTDGTVAPCGPVVVGVSGATCAPAVAGAFHEAALRHVPVHAFHAWSFPPPPAFGLHAVPPPPGRAAFAAAQRDAETMLAEVTTPFRAAFPDVEVAESVINRPPVGALVDLSESAGLTVVALHPRPRDCGRTIGRVAYAALHHAHSAVLLVPTG
ncbi:universal stress protein [Yinghuangia soli]|uniref:Universal stress protein n=1 Tax=Yinghuangia soli TaxID=2908204 RepID=A0AA41PZX8_9ACTN|nr:universal stress protein [Yinghuangia soli]MCF2528918.1 universal stress protein [Yinghuangia soli]